MTDRLRHMTARIIGLRFAIAWVATLLIVVFTAPHAGLGEGLIVATLAAGSAQNAGLALGLMRGTKGLEQLRTTTGNTRVPAWCQRAAIRGYVPFSGLLVLVTIGIVLIAYSTDAPGPLGNAVALTFAVVFALLLLWWIASMVSRRPRRLMPPVLRTLDNRGLAEFLAQPEPSGFEEFSDEYVVDGRGRCWWVDADGTRRRVPRSEALDSMREHERDATTSPAGSADQARRAHYGLPRDHD